MTIKEHNLAIINYHKNELALETYKALKSIDFSTCKKVNAIAHEYEQLESKISQLKTEIKYMRDDIKTTLVYLNNNHINSARETLLKALNKEEIDE